MTTRTSPILLADINPEEVAISTMRLISKQLIALMNATGDFKAIDVDFRAMPMFQAIVDLIYYAQSGRYPSDAGRRLAEICRALYGSAASPTIQPLGSQGTEIGCAIVAAQARIALSKGQPVSYHGIAALGGIPLTKAQAIVAKHRAGSKGGSAEMLPGPALAWLCAQNVPGFEPA